MDHFIQLFKFPPFFPILNCVGGNKSSEKMQKSNKISPKIEWKSDNVSVLIPNIQSTVQSVWRWYKIYFLYNMLFNGIEINFIFSCVLSEVDIVSNRNKRVHVAVT